MTVGDEIKGRSCASKTERSGNKKEGSLVLHVKSGREINLGVIRNRMREWE